MGRTTTMPSSYAAIVDKITRSRNGYPTVSNNTNAQFIRDDVHDDGLSIGIYLHGSRIAVVRPETVAFNLCGWNSAVTRDRISEVVSRFGVFVTSRNGGPVIGRFSDHLTRPIDIRDNYVVTVDTVAAPDGHYYRPESDALVMRITPLVN